MTTSPVRVRVAPSPTGDPHVGTAYIALFNMVFARKHGGKFILRIEDTDQTRSTPQSEAAIVRSLRWVGIEWDEGPDVGGPYGPYRQSERKELYVEHARRLVDSGHAYYCFCPPERLERLRTQQRRMKQPTRYDGKCRRLSRTDVDKLLAENVPHVVRLKVERPGTVVIPDLLRGDIEYNLDQIDDQVLLKSDGFPTYHLANVVDDHLMEITHVIRAEEWIPSTPKHLLLYRAFGWQPPQFVHLPLLRNADRSKISKRKNPTSIDFYRQAGILPEALLNFLALMGWSMPEDREKFTLDEMIEAFTWDRMSLSGPVFNVEKLEWLNGLYIRDFSVEELQGRIADTVFSPQRLARIVPLVQERMRRLDEFVELTPYFFRAELTWDAAQLIPKGLDKRTTYRALRDLSEQLDAVVDWSAPVLEEILRGYAAAQEAWDNRKLFMLIRLVVTGRKASPPLFETMEAIGKPFCQYRMRAAARLLRP